MLGVMEIVIGNDVLIILKVMLSPFTATSPIRLK